jgi:hypothetical protein
MYRNNEIDRALSHPVSQFRAKTKPRGGAPKGNRNAWKHGTFSAGNIAVRRQRRAEVRGFIRSHKALCAIAQLMFLEEQARQLGHGLALRRKRS